MVIKNISQLKRFSLLVAVNLIVVLSFSQQKQIVRKELKWFPVKENKLNDQESIQYFGFESSLYNFDNQKITPFLHHIQEWTLLHEAEIEIVNVLTERLSDEQIALLDLSKIGSQFIVNQEISVSRGKYYLIADIFPFIKNKAGEYERLISFDLEITAINKTETRQSLRQSFTNSSVLNKNDWYKIGVTQDGIYKLTYSALKNMGIDIDNISPDAINIYGNSFGMIPETNSVPRPDDLLKNSIYIEGDGDGNFGSSDYILFYAKGADTWTLNGTNFEMIRHPYSDTSYYFIEIDTANLAPKRLSNANLSTASATHTVTTFNDYKSVHQDLYNLMKSGKEWLGDHFDVITDYSYPFSFPNIDGSSPVRFKLSIAAKTPGNNSSSFSISVPEAGYSANTSIGGVGSGPYPYNAIYAGGGSLINNLSTTSSNLTVNISFNRFSAASEGWLDYIEMNARRNLIYTNSPLEFRDVASVGAGNIAEFNVSNVTSSVFLWEVTDPTNAKTVNATLNAGTYQFKMSADTLRSFIAFNPANAAVPQYFGRVANQDLHALPYADMLIVTHPDYLTQAEELAMFHQTEGLSVHIVTTQQVYNEFSSGMKDAAAIRMFFKMFYDRAAGDTTLMPKYGLLFGDGSYDNKYRLPGNTAFIPTYHNSSAGQMYIINSYTSDDFYGMLDDNESMGGGNLMDIAIGRICSRSGAEATAVVNKIIAYSTEVAPLLNSGCCETEVKPTLEDWRNWITFIADDEDYNAYINAADNFSDYISTNYPDYLIKKIYLDAYNQTSTPGGKRYYEAEDAIREKVQAGSLLVNYIGHGGEVGWAHERILDLATINNWSNSPRLPVFMTATCEFSRYDDPSRTSAGEYILLNPDGGGIALMTTTRLVISGPNEQLNTYFIQCFLNRAANYERPRIGDFYLESKNMMSSLSSGNANQTRNFTLLGDPAVQFKMPYHNIITDSLNGISISASPDTLKALSVVTIKGHIEDEAGNFLPGFNGIITPVVFDKDQNITTLANDAPLSIPLTFSVTKNVIYRGKATVTNGRFQFTFVVPKDIAFQFGNGTLSYYAHNGITDANGKNKSVIVGGANTNAPTDVNGPEMDVYLNDENFVNGGITNSNPFLVVKVSDQNGMNTVGNGIGHDLTAVLDGNSSNTIILNEYYEADLDTYQSGRIKYQLSGLTPGTHTIKVKVWDVYNNSSEKELEFVVQDEAEMALDHVLNYPNPFTTNTVFMLEHNQVCQTLDVKITIMTISGKIVKTIMQTVNAEGFRIDPIAWDGLDEYGDKLAIGTYIYKVEVDAGEKSVEQYEKLVILR